MAVTTRVRVKRRLDMLSPSTTDTELDQKVDSLILAVTAAFENCIQLPHLTASKTELHSIGPWQSEIWLRNYQGRLMPVPTITSVKARTHWRDAFADIDALDTTLYTLSSDFPGMLIYDGHWPEGKDTVQVILSAGFAATTDAFVTAFPAIADAADEQCVWEFLRRMNPEPSTVSVHGLTSNQQSSVALLPAVAERLQPYCRVSIP